MALNYYPQRLNLPLQALDIRRGIFDGGRILDTPPDDLGRQLNDGEAAGDQAQHFRHDRQTRQEKRAIGLGKEGERGEGRYHAEGASLVSHLYGSGPTVLCRSVSALSNAGSVCMDT